MSLASYHFHTAINQHLAHSHTNYFPVAIVAVAVASGLMLLDKLRAGREARRSEIGSVAALTPAPSAALPLAA